MSSSTWQFLSWVGSRHERFRLRFRWRTVGWVVTASTDAGDGLVEAPDDPGPCEQDREDEDDAEHGGPPLDAVGQDVLHQDDDGRADERSRRRPQATEDDHDDEQDRAVDVGRARADEV